MSKPFFALAFLATLLAFAPAAHAADVHVQAHKGPADADAQIAADAPSTGLPAAAPDAPQAPASPVTAPHPNDVIELASIHTGTASDAGSFDISTRASGDSPAQADGSVGESIAHAVIPVVQAAAPTTVAAIGIAALLQGLGVWRFAGLGAIGLYSRLTKSELLDNEHRDRVYKLIQETPGLGVSEISQKTGLGWGTTVYHLDRLERAGFVAPERGGIHKCFYPVGTIARESRKAMGALKSDATRTIAVYLTANPGTTQTDLCAALGLSASALSKQVSKLESAGLVRRERDWKTVHLHPTEALPALLAPTVTVATPAPFETPLAV